MLVAGVRLVFGESRPKENRKRGWTQPAVRDARWVKEQWTELWVRSRSFHMLWSWGPFLRWVLAQVSCSLPNWQWHFQGGAALPLPVAQTHWGGGQELRQQMTTSLSSARMTCLLPQTLFHTVWSIAHIWPLLYRQSSAGDPIFPSKLSSKNTLKSEASFPLEPFISPFFNNTVSSFPVHIPRSQSVHSRLWGWTDSHDQPVQMTETCVITGTL